MTTNDMTIRIGGAAGDGVESSGAGFCKALTRAGLYVFGLPDYYSRIRGGHNFYSVRISDRSLYSHDEPVHLLLALTAETVPRHREALVPGAMVVYDSAFDVPPEHLEIEGVTVVPLPMSELAQEAAGTTLARNTVALGFAAGLTGLDVEPLQTVIRDNFARKGQAVVDGNLAAVQAGYERGQEHAEGYAFKLELPLCVRLPDDPRLAGLALDGRPRQAVRRDDQAHRGRDRGDQHGRRRSAHGRARPGPHLGRRLFADGRGLGAGRYDRDPGGDL
jgi:2-oxoglutarate ferredoxin oxidoreductase subunit alpha